MSCSLAFLDTDILVHTNDTDEPTKRDIARTTIRRLMTSDEGVVSSQILDKCMHMHA